MTLTPLTLPPTAPSRSDVPATFITRADAFVNWQSVNLVPELNALLPEIVLAGSANNYGATSTTSLAIATGSKTLTVQIDKAFQIGQFVQIANTANPSNYMFGQVTAYNATTGLLTVNVSSVGGSGTFTAWTVGLAATGGAYAQLAGATFTGGISAPSINFGDATAYATLTGGNVNFVGDSNDFLAYVRSSNFWRFHVGGSARFDISETGGKLYGDWLFEGVTYFNNDSNFGVFLSGGSPVILRDVGDYDNYDRVANSFKWVIGNTLRHQFTATQHLINSDPVVTRTSTDTLTNKTLTSPTINSAALNPTGSAPLFPARAWVKFNGSGTVAIIGSGNVSSITDNGTGNYTVNFTTAMPDTNYDVQVTVGDSGPSAVFNRLGNYYNALTSSIGVTTSVGGAGSGVDFDRVSVKITE